MAAISKWEIKITRKNNFFGVLLTIFLVMLVYKWNFTVDIRQNKCSNWFMYPLIALSGIYMVIYASKLIEAYCHVGKMCIAFLGKNTLYILFLHILIFKIIGLFQIHILGDEYAGNYAQWGNVNTQGIWAYIYCFLGVAVPGMISVFIKKLLTKKSMKEISRS